MTFHINLAGPNICHRYEKIIYELLHNNFNQSQKYWNTINKKYLKDLMVIKNNNLLNIELFK